MPNYVEYRQLVESGPTQKMLNESFLNGFAVGISIGAALAILSFVLTFYLGRKAYLLEKDRGDKAYMLDKLRIDAKIFELCDQCMTKANDGEAYGAANQVSAIVSLFKLGDEHESVRPSIQVGLNELWNSIGHKLVFFQVYVEKRRGVGGWCESFRPLADFPPPSSD